jgi:electron transfer flavoprotein alpha subunit
MSNILFLCQHGGAKSVIAATYLQAAGFEAAALAAEDPYEAVPAPVVELLGPGVADFKPRRAEDADLAQAERVIAIGCDVPGAEQWSDVPMVSEDLPGAVAAIRRHVDELVAELRRRG